MKTGNPHQKLSGNSMKRSIFCEKNLRRMVTNPQKWDCHALPLFAPFFAITGSVGSAGPLCTRASGATSGSAVLGAVGGSLGATLGCSTAGLTAPQRGMG